MVGVAQLVEHRIVAPAVVGSNPIVHPIYYSGVYDSDELHTICPVTAHECMHNLKSKCHKLMALEMEEIQLREAGGCTISFI